jgi:hypothetical protein
MERFYEVVEELVVPLQRKVFTKPYESTHPIVLDKVVALSYITDSATDVCREARRFGTQQERLATTWRLQAQKNPYNCSLARSVAPQQPIYTAPWYFEVDAVQNTSAIEVFNKLLDFDNVLTHSIALSSRPN